MAGLKFRSGFDLKEGSFDEKERVLRKSKCRVKKTFIKEKAVKQYVRQIKTTNEQENEKERVYEDLKGAEIEIVMLSTKKAGAQTQKAAIRVLEKAKLSFQRNYHVKTMIERVGRKRIAFSLIKGMTKRKRILEIKAFFTKYMAILICGIVLLLCLFISVGGGVSSQIDMAGGQDNITSAYLYLGTLEANKGNLNGNGMSIDAEPIMAYMISEFGLKPGFDDKQKSQLVKMYNEINDKGYRKNADSFFSAYHADVFSSEANYTAYKKLMNEGIYTQFKTLGSPFVGKNWTSMISSAWGWRYHPISGGIKLHRGLDIQMGAGTPVNSVCSGKVMHAGWYGGYGNCVMVRHKEGDTDVTVLYGHLSSISVRNGLSVNEGAVIGKVGSTGRSTGPHLHIEVMAGGYSSDISKLYYPRIYLNEDKERKNE